MTKMTAGSNTNADLVAEANRLLSENQWTSGWGVESLAERLAARLEADEKRAEEAERERDSAMASYEEYMRIHRERDALAAVVEKVREVLQPDEAKLGRTPRSVLEEARSALATAPDDALRDVKADVWDEGAGDMAEHIEDGAWWEIQNPYQEGQS